MPSPETRLQKKAGRGATRDGESQESLLAEAADQLSTHSLAHQAIIPYIAWSAQIGTESSAGLD